jgi:Zn-finger nucleic acid-binding protein
MRLDRKIHCFKCEFCATEYTPEPDVDGVQILNDSTAYRCPICQDTLAEGVLVGVGVLHCRACGGVLVQMNEFAGLIGVLRAARGAFVAPARPFEVASLDRRIECPKCHTAMDTHPYGGPGNVTIDSCETCESNWLDRGELARIVGASDYDRAAFAPIAKPEQDAPASCGRTPDPLRLSIGLIARLIR